MLQAEKITALCKRVKLEHVGFAIFLSEPSESRFTFVAHT
jgi:hypothetical protein